MMPSRTDLPFLPPPEKRRKAARPEQEIQRTVVQHLERRGVPGLVWTHIPNGGWRSPIEAKILKGQGVRKGFPDLVLFHEHHSFALELKAPGGELTPEQEACLLALREAGVSATHAHGLDQAIRILEIWGLLKGTASLGVGAEA